MQGQRDKDQARSLHRKLRSRKKVLQVVHRTAMFAAFAKGDQPRLKLQDGISSSHNLDAGGLSIRRCGGSRCIEGDGNHTSVTDQEIGPKESPQETTCCSAGRTSAQQSNACEPILHGFDQCCERVQSPCTANKCYCERTSFQDVKRT